MANEVDTTLLDNLNSIKNSKADIKQALIDKGQNPTNVFADYAQLISDIQTGEDLSEELSAQEAKLAQLESILENKTAGKAKLNIFAQENEPTEKNGIWLQSNKSFDKVCVDTDIVANEEWSNETFLNLPYNLLKGSVVIKEDDIFIFGGETNKTAAYKYSLKNKNLTKLANIPRDFYQGVAIAYKNSIYLIGGMNNLRKLTKYDIDTDTYESIDNLPINFAVGLAILDNDFIYIGGGAYGQDFYKYDILNNTYSRLPDIPYTTTGVGYTKINNNIFLFGSGNSGSTNKAYKFNIMTENFEQIQNIPYDFKYGSVINVNENIYLIGGEVSTKYLYKYDYEKGIYTKLADIPFSFYNRPAINYNDEKILLFGGSEYPTTIKSLNMLVKEYEDNSILISQGVGDYNTQLINAGTSGNLNYYFHDVWHYTKANGLDKTIPTYYGDGTQWIKFKN